MCRKSIYLISSVLLVGLVATEAANAADPNLIAWWRFNGNYNDSSGNGHQATGVYGNPEFVPGHDGSALDFDDFDNDRVEVPSATPRAGFAFTGEITWAVWIKTSGAPSTYGSSLIMQGPPGAKHLDGDKFLCLLGSGEISMLACNVKAATPHASFVRVDDGQWHHVAVTIEFETDGEKDTIKLYIDGDLDKGFTASVNINSQNYKAGTTNDATYHIIILGSQYNKKDNHDKDRHYDGLLDEVRIYNKALTDAEIEAIVAEEGYPYACLPYPADDALFKGTSVSLTWERGDFAADVNGHDVYFGDNLGNVIGGTGGTSKGLTSDTSYPVSDLVPGTTYYWRIDEVNDNAWAPDGSPWKGEVWSFRVAPRTAYAPIPPDGAKFVPTDPNLSWSAGLGVDLHDVYFGTDYNDVNDADLSSSEYQGFTTDPDTLWGDGGLEALNPAPVKDTTYYWRIDEFDGSDTHKGDVWTFRTRPVMPITDPNLVGWWKLDYEGAGADTTVVDYSSHDHYGTLQDDPQWAAGYIDDALEFDGSFDYVNIDGYKGVLGTHAFSVCAWVKTTRTSTGDIVCWGSADNRLEFLIASNVLQAQFGLGSLKGQTNVNDGEWHHAAVTVKANATASYPDVKLYRDGRDDTTPITDEDAVNIVSDADLGIGWRPTHGEYQFFDGLIDDVRLYDRELSEQDILLIYRGFDLALAWDPNPEDGAINVPLDATLSWKPGEYAPDPNGHKVYFGADDPGNMVLVSTPNQPQDPNFYTPPELLDLGTTYYWAVDEVNDAADDGVDAGEIWNFTTIEHLTVDDMDTYTPWDVADNNIFDIWVDGSGNCVDIAGNGTGSYVYVEESIASDGNSMALHYDNDGMAFNPCPDVEADEERKNYSMAKAQVANLPSGIGSDWSAGGSGAKALSLQFYGDQDNDANETERMWVELTDGNGGAARVIYGTYDDEDDVNDIQKASWHEWNIDLQDFNDGGVNLSDVNSIAIGFGDPNATEAGGSGTVYFDDITLHGTRCVLSKRSAAFAKADFITNDDEGCVVNYKELEIMGSDWLLTDDIVATTAPPGPDNLMVHYRFDGNNVDSSGNDRHGVLAGGPQFMAGVFGDALEFDGVDDCVSTGGYQGVKGPNAFSVAAWIKTSAETGEIACWGNNTSGYRMEFRIDSGGLLRGTLGLSPPVSGQTYVNDGEWHHAAVTVKDNARCRYPDVVIYLDGLDDSILSTSQNWFNIVPELLDMGVGWRPMKNDRFFDGLIDDFRLYDVVLSEAQVAYLADVTPEDGQLYVPVPSLGNPYDEEPPLSKSVNFKDLAAIGNMWLEEEMFP